MDTRRPVHKVAVCKHCTYGKTCSKGFCKAGDVSSDLKILHGKEGACPETASLDFIGYEENIIVCADFSYFLVKLCWRNYVPSFLLEGVDENGSSIVRA